MKKDRPLQIGRSLLLGTAGAWIAASCAVTDPGNGHEAVLSPAGRKRAELRAFYTAPPVIPHDIDDRGNESCLDCHYEQDENDNWIPLNVPHAMFTNCRQCHVALESPIKIAGTGLDTSWLGLEEPSKGARAHEQAPPAIPHRAFLRENCLSCHGQEALTEGVATSHPERKNCGQCHVANAEREF